MRSILKHLLLAGLAIYSAASPGQGPFPSLEAKPVALCDAPQPCERVGRIRVLGMLELPSRTVNHLRFAELSGLAWDDDEGVLYALSDKGKLFGLRPAFRKGRLTDVALVSVATLFDPATHKPVRWRRSDSEGLEILNGHNGHRGDTELLISFEREPRIARYRLDGRFVADVPLPAILRDVKRYHGGNKMLESVCMHPREGILTAPEEPLDGENGATRLYRMDGASWRFPPSRGGISALECLPGGDVLVLERDYQALSLRTIITLRRLHLPGGTAPDSTLTAETLAVLDTAQGLHIDNFEGLARHRGNRFFMVSDNNDVFLQRTLLLYFEMTDAPAGR